MGVRFVCIYYVNNMSGHLKMLACLQLSYSRSYQLGDGEINYIS